MGAASPLGPMVLGSRRGSGRALWGHGWLPLRLAPLPNRPKGDGAGTAHVTRSSAEHSKGCQPKPGGPAAAGGAHASRRGAGGVRVALGRRGGRLPRYPAIGRFLLQASPAAVPAPPQRAEQPPPNRRAVGHRSRGAPSPPRPSTSLRPLGCPPCGRAAGDRRGRWQAVARGDVAPPPPPHPRV